MVVFPVAGSVAGCTHCMGVGRPIVQHGPRTGVGPRI